MHPDERVAISSDHDAVSPSTDIGPEGAKRADTGESSQARRPADGTGSSWTHNSASDMVSDRSLWLAQNVSTYTEDPDKTEVAPSSEPAGGTYGAESILSPHEQQADHLRSDSPSESTSRDAAAQLSPENTRSQNSEDFGVQENLPFDNSEDALVSIKQEVSHNEGVIVGVLHQTVRRMLDSHDLRSDYVSEVAALFEPPDNISTAAERLRQSRIVVLVGDYQSGRHSAAVSLLHEQGGLELREVRREPGDGFITENLVSRRPTGWILDLRGDIDSVALNFGRVLATSSALLTSTDSFLVVVIRRGLWEKTRAGAMHLAVELSPPDAVKVIERRLQHLNPSLSPADIERWTGDGELRRYLENLPPARAVEWAEAIREEHFAHADSGIATTASKLNADDAFRLRVANVIKSRGNWRTDLLEWHRKNPDSRRRNFLLATALLEDASAADIYTAAEELAQTFREPEPVAPGQTGPGLIELLDDVNATLADDDSVSYARTGFANAVLDYFWLDRMHLRGDFMSWATSLPLRHEGKSAQEIADRVGQYSLRWSIQRNDLELVEKAVLAWAEHENAAPSAEALLSAAALDSVLGSNMRARMLTWSKSDTEISPRVQVIVAQVCGGPVGAIYPKLMLYRLGHLAKSFDPKVRKAVEEATFSLWARFDLRDQIRSEIAKWLDSPQEAQSGAGRRAFTTLASLTEPSGSLPILLSSDGNLDVATLETGREFLVKGWRSVFNQRRPDSKADAAFALFMEAALASEEFRIELLSVLVDSVHRSGDGMFHATRRVSLDNLAFRWQPSSAGEYGSDRQRIRDELILMASNRDPVLPNVASLPNEARSDE